MRRRSSRPAWSDGAAPGARAASGRRGGGGGVGRDRHAGGADVTRTEAGAERRRLASARPRRGASPADGLDPVTFALLEAALRATSVGVGAAVRHASYSPIIREMLDYSC